MNKRQRKKFATIDASGVKEIAEMQRYIDSLENYLWSMAMFIDGKDNGKTIVKFTKVGEMAEFATIKIYEFIKECLEKKGDAK